MKEATEVLKRVEEDDRVWINQGTLNIKKVQRADGGKYICIPRNSVGERRIETELVVTGKCWWLDKIAK